MASIRKRGKRYYLRYWDVAHVRHEVALGTSDAEEAKRKAYAKLDELEATVRPVGRSLTVRQAWEAFEATVLPGKREGTRIAYKSAMAHNWLPAIGEEGLTTLSPQRVREALDAMPLSPSTKALRRNQLSGVFKWAISEGWAYRNPCRDIVIDGKRKPRTDTLAPRYLRLLVANAPLETRPAIAVLAYAGLRVGELRGLTWEDVRTDTDEPFLSISKSVYREGREAIARTGEPFSPPKSDAGIREVFISRPVVAELERWRPISQGQANNAWDLVFPNAWGGPLRHEALCRHVREAARIVAALPEAAPAKRQKGEEPFDAEAITPRTLRHAYARLMLYLGMSLPELQRQMGHSHFETTLRYARYEAKERPVAVKALDAFHAVDAKKGRYLPHDLDDRRKHAIGRMNGEDVGDFLGEERGKQTHRPAVPAGQEQEETV